MPIVFYFICDLLIVLILLYMFSKLMDHMYHRKDRPKKTKTWCKRKKRFLTDQELFFGKCYGCVADQKTAKQNCLIDITENGTHVKS